MTTAQLIALLSSPLAPVLAGIVGSILEKIGMAYSLPRLIALGKMLESVAADLPKLITNVVALAKGEPKDPPSSGPDDTVRIIPPPTPFFPPDRSRLHNDSPDEPAECRSWRHPAWRLLAFGVLLVCAGCSVFRSVTPTDRAEAYAAQARAAELACKAYVFDRSQGLVGDVPSMAKLCAGE